MALPKAEFHVVKDSGGTPTLICLDSEGRVPVTSEAPGSFLCADAVTITPTDTTQSDVVTITGALTKCYDNFEWVTTSITETRWQLCYIDDAVGTPVTRTLAEWITGPGQYTVCCNLDGKKIDTTGQTGTQEFKIKGNAVSSDCLGDFSGSLCLKERDA